MAIGIELDTCTVSVMPKDTIVRDSEHHAARDGLARRSDRLDDVQRAIRVRARRGSEQQATEHAEDDGLGGELGGGLRRGDVGLEASRGVGRVVDNGRMFPKERAQLFLLLALVALVWLAFRLYTGIALEDALITWRYAESLAVGNGFTFNPGERVLGSSTPLTVVLLAAVARILGTGAIPTGAVIVMMCCGLCSGWLIYHLIRHAGIGHPVALLASGAAMLHPDTVWSTVGGMETALVVALMMASLYASCLGRYLLASVACALLVFARPDAVVWVALIALHAWWHGRRAAIRDSLGGGALILSGLAALTSYFGSPLPQSVRAKQIIGQALDQPLDLYSVRHWFNWGLGAFGVDPFGGLTGTLSTGIWALCLLLGIAPILRTPAGRRLWPLLVFPPCLAAAYLVQRAPHFQWYLVPYTACLCVVGALGAAELWALLRGRAAAERTGRGVFTMAAVLAAALIGAEFAHGLRSAVTFHQANQENEQTVRRAVGEWIADHSDPSSVAVMEAIGYQGTYSHRRVVDLAGLITPRVVELRQASRSNAEAFGRVLDEFKPDYVVLRSFEVAENRHYHGGALFETAAEARSFADTYQAVATFTAPNPAIWHASSSVTIHARR